MIHRGVVIEPGSPLLKDRGEDFDLEASGQFAKLLRRGPRDRLGQRKVLIVFRLREIPAGKEFLRHDKARPLAGRIADHLQRLGDVFFGVRSAGMLHQTEADNGRGVGG